MAKANRHPANTVQNLVAAMQNAIQGEIDPPAYVRLREGDREFWGAIMRTRARTEWTDADLVNAGNMARCMADIERISRELEVEGDVVENARGTQVANPKHALLESMSRRIMALMRLMQMNARSTGQAEDKVKARAQEATARRAKADLDAEDDLIPS
jgi:hypothetical protein